MDMDAHEANDVTDSQRRFQRATGPAGRTRTAEPVVPSDGGARDAAATGRRAAASGQLMAGRYLLEAQIGEGAHATTWRAHDRRLKRPVAIKMLRAHLTTDPELVARFIREAELAASISHPNVVDVYDVGTDDDTSYIVMRYVPGRDLRDLLRGDGRLALSQTVPIVRQVLLGLGSIHAAGIVHRDVKPQNILITPDGTAQVTDFGVAYAALAEGLTTQGMTVGTAAYMAPEQARGGHVSPATDIYAVGVVMYEMLTGRPPYAGDNPMAVMFAHLHDTPPMMASVAPGLHLPAGVEPLVRRAMAREPEQRFPTAHAMIHALSGDLAAAPDATTTVRTSAATSASAGSHADQPTVVTRPLGPSGQPRGAIPAPGDGGAGAAPPRYLADQPRGRGGWWFIVSVVFLALAAVILAAALHAGPFGGGNATVTSLPAIAPSRSPSAPAVVATMTTTPSPTDTTPPTVTAEPPTATALPPTETPVPPTETSVPPTATTHLPTATDIPPTFPPTATVPPAFSPPTETAVPVELDPTQQINPIGLAPGGQESTGDEIVSANAPGNGQSNGNAARQRTSALGTSTPMPTSTPKPKPKHTPKARD